MRHPEFPVVSLLLIPLLLCSLPSHIRAGSVCVITLVAWMTALNIIHAVNSLVWANNVVVRLEVWCDITTKVLIGYTYAVPLSALCICRQLENVSANRQVMITQADKSRRMKFEAILCFGVPMVFMALHYVVQGHRFDLIEDFGCSPATYVSVAGLFIVWIPPLVISLTTMVYAVAAFHHFLQRRIEFAAVLRSSNSAISPARYFRLMAFAVFEILFDSSTNIYVIYFNINLTGLRPWVSWDNVHSNFSRIGLFPHFLVPSWVNNQFIWQWWIIPASCLFFILFFGFGEEAVADYRIAIHWLQRAVFRRDIKSSTSAILPTHRRTVPRHVALTPSSDDLSMHAPKDWDELSLKMPETSDSFPSTTHFIHHTTSLDVSESLTQQTPEKDAAPLSALSEYSWPTESQQSTSMESVPSDPLERSTPLPPAHDAHYRSPPYATPAVTVSRPESDVSFSAGGDTLVLPSTVQMALQPIPSSATSRPSSYRRSMSTDLGITVSPAYHPDHDTASRYHEEARLTPAAFSDVLPSRPELAHTHPFGGVQMTVEKNVD